MSINSVIITVALLFLAACSSSGPKSAVVNSGSISVATISKGVVNNPNIPFPIYLTDAIENRDDLITKIAPNVFVVQTGHILKANLTKTENEAILASLADKKIDLVNLSLEDFIIADHQEISFEKYPQKFLNSSIVDLNEDNIIAKPNIVPYVLHNGIALFGLSDKNIDKSLAAEKFLVSDYVLAILRARKNIMREAASANPPIIIRAYVIIHTMGAEIDEVMDRLPPNFINSLAN